MDVIIYSRDDGTVAWRSGIDLRQPEDCFAITGAHMAVASNAEVRAILLRRLGE